MKRLGVVMAAIGGTQSSVAAPATSPDSLPLRLARSPILRRRWKDAVPESFQIPRLRVAHNRRETCYRALPGSVPAAMRTVLLLQDPHTGDVSFGPFTIVRADERVVGPNGALKLGRKAYRLLLMLADQGGQLVTKDAMFSTIWDGTIVTESALTSVVKELRRALDDNSAEPRYIESVYGRGYRLLPPIGTLERRPVARNEDGDGSLGVAPLLVVQPCGDNEVDIGLPDFPSMLDEEVLTALSRFREIRLVSDASPRTGALAGDRNYHLAARLLRRGDDLQVSMRLTRSADGAILWAEQMRLPTGDAMGRIDEIARRISGTAIGHLRDDLLRTVPRQQRTGYDRYFANRLRMRDLDDVEEARAVADAWEGLIAAHPDLVRAYPPLIRLYNTDFCFTGLGATGAEERARAYELAHRAVAIDPADSHLHTVKAWCHLWAGEPGLAERHFEQALRLNPAHHERLIEAATGFMFLEELDRAQDLLDRCRTLAIFAGEATQEEEGLLLLLREDHVGAASALALARWAHPDDRAMARPSMLSGLYALLAAAGAGSPDLADAAGEWSAQAARRWVGAEPLTRDGLKRWAQFHNPFQDRQRQKWLCVLIDRAFAPLSDPVAGIGGQALQKSRS